MHTRAYFLCLLLLVRRSEELIKSNKNSDCCQKKIVSEPAHLAGTYQPMRKSSVKENERCLDDCIYRKEGSTDNLEYCFASDPSGSFQSDDQCVLVPG